METVYELKDSRSPLKKALPYGVMTIIFFAASFVVKMDTFSWFLLGLSLITAGVAVANYLKSNSPTVLLTNDAIVVQGQGTERKVSFAEMSKAELTVKDGEKSKRVNVFAEDANTFAADEKSVLYIADSKNKRVEVAAENYDISDFRSFVEVFISVANNGRMTSATQIGELIKQNQQYLKQDQLLREEMQNTLLDAYKALYIPRGDYHLKENPTAKVIYKYQKNPNESAVYFLDGDYAAGLESTNIEAGINLVEATQRNVQVVDTRIASYRSIEEKLLNMKSLDEAANKMRAVAGQLENLQNRNQNAQDNNQELALQAETLKQLQLLTEEIHSVDDLDKSLVLKERVALME